MSDPSNFYELLGLPADATPEEIRQAYREAARKLHPDTRESPGHTEFFLQVQEAYEVLSDSKKRRDYDKRLEIEGKTQRPITIQTIYSRPTLSLIDEPQLIYVLLELIPRPTEQHSNPAINTCLIIDRSTSMQGERMDTVKHAAIELTRRLKTDDLLSIIAFSDRAEVIVPAGRTKNQGIVETQIRMIHAGGGTEIFQGLEKGFSEIQRHLHKSPINHIFLLTDGRTYGDEEACLHLADKAAREGVRITGLGIGSEWNDDFVDAMAARTGGGSFFISKDSDIIEFLEEKFEGLGQVFAEQVLLHLEDSSSGSLRSAYRLQPDPSELIIDLPLRLGSIARSSQLSVLLEFIVPPILEKLTRFTLASGRLSLVIPCESRAPQYIPLLLTRLIGDSATMDMPPPPIFQALSQITLYRMQARAYQEVAEGKIQEGSQRLERVATQLFAMGEKELAATAAMEAHRIQQTRTFSADGAKQIKYGTRSLILPSRLGGEP